MSDWATGNGVIGTHTIWSLICRRRATGIRTCGPVPSKLMPPKAMPCKSIPPKAVPPKAIRGGHPGANLRRRPGGPCTTHSWSRRCGAPWPDGTGGRCCAREYSSSTRWPAGYATLTSRFSSWVRPRLRNVTRSRRACRRRTRGRPHQVWRDRPFSCQRTAETREATTTFPDRDLTGRSYQSPSSPPASSPVRSTLRADHRGSISTSSQPHSS
jgi:hypothetical protein